MIGDLSHIIVIQSLKDNEVQTGINLYNDIIKRQIERLKSLISHEFYNVKEKEKLFEILKYVNAQAPYFPKGILIHLEMHGSKNLDGLVLSSDTIIEWSELVEYFRLINISSCNQLYITMATCFGRRASIHMTNHLILPIFRLQK
jgi:hypothetical protein